MPIDFTQLVKLAQGLSFKTFLIVCVAVLSYAVVHLYQDNQAAWAQVQANTNSAAQVSQKVEVLVTHIAGLENDLRSCLRVAPAHASTMETYAPLWLPVLNGQPVNSLDKSLP